MRIGETEDVVVLFSPEPPSNAEQSGDTLVAAPASASAFFVGPENRVLVPLVRAVLGASNTAWNPVVVCGPSGSGKTHLALELTNAWRRTHSRRARAVYAAASDFAKELADAIEAGATDEFRARYRSAALVAIDELSHLRAKPVVQQELVFTIDAMTAAGNRVVFTSSVVPDALPDFLPALRSRLCSGLVTTLSPPGTSTRKALLRHFAALQEIEITDKAVDMLAQDCVAGPAALKGVLAKLSARASLFCQTIDEHTISDFLRAQQGDSLAWLRAITTETCRYFSLRAGELRGQSRKRRVATARAIAIFLARELTNNSLKQIGEYFGGRDHSTILHSYLKVKSALDADGETRKAVDAITQQLQAPLLKR